MHSGSPVVRMGWNYVIDKPLNKFSAKFRRLFVFPSEMRCTEKYCDFSSLLPYGGKLYRKISIGSSFQLYLYLWCCFWTPFHLHTKSIFKNIYRTIDFRSHSDVYRICIVSSFQRCVLWWNECISYSSCINAMYKFGQITGRRAPRWYSLMRCVRK